MRLSSPTRNTLLDIRLGVRKHADLSKAISNNRDEPIDRRWILATPNLEYRVKHSKGAMPAEWRPPDLRSVGPGKINDSNNLCLEQPILLLNDCIWMSRAVDWPS